MCKNRHVPILQECAKIGTSPFCTILHVPILHEELKENYMTHSLEVMSSLKSEDTLIPMVFAEQRLLSMISKKMGIRLDTFSTLEILQKSDKRFTHLWGYKEKLKNNPAMKEEFTKRLKDKIKGL